MGVQSDGSYAVERGLYFGFPVTVDADGRYHIVDGLKLDPTIEARFQRELSRLIAERDALLAIDSN